MFNSYIIDEDIKLFTFVNPYSYLIFRENKVFIKSFNVYVDGILLVGILNLFGFKNVARKSFDMTSLAPIVFDSAIKENKSMYFIGAKPHVIDKAIKNIRKEFVNLDIIGFRDGYIKPKERKKVLENIKNIDPNIIVCGMGAPLQEQFLVDLQSIGWNGVGYTCGGFLHQTERNIQYYPEWIDKCDLRWAYRMYDEPVLFKRYFWEYPKFFIFFIYDFIKERD